MEQSPSGSTVDERIFAYKAAIRAMCEGNYAIEIPNGHHDPMGRLGAELRRLAEYLERQFDEARKLAQVTESAMGGLILDDVLNRVYEAFDAIIPYDRMGYALISDDQQHVTAYWARTKYPEPKLTPGFSAPLAGSSLNRMLDTGEPRILNDLESYLAEYPDSVPTRIMVAEGVRSSLTCPLIAQGKPVGFLFFSSTECYAYRDLHQGIFLRIAAQLSILLEKSRLYQEVIEINQRLECRQRELEEQAMQDPLTGIYNRRGILDLLRLQHSRTLREKLPLSVIMVDVDLFKKINDGHGHQTGDMVLKSVARALSGNLREYNYLGRFGGEEFLVVLGDAGFDTAQMIASRLRTAVSANVVPVDGKALSVTISLGVASIEDASRLLDVEQLITVADEALYEAKRRGRNAFVCRRIG